MLPSTIFEEFTESADSFARVTAELVISVVSNHFPEQCLLLRMRS